MQITIDYTDLLGAYALWEKEYRKNPDGFADDTETSLLKHAENQANALFGYIAKYQMAYLSLNDIECE